MPQVSTREAAERLDLSRQHVALLVKRGVLKAQRIGHSYAIDERSLEAFANRDRPGPGRPSKPVRSKRSES